jgi:UDP-GlcNAc:undecaprenyl-phosphate GlcNAc-1-phosphate transferase
MQNSINLLDGVDGLAAGVVAIVGGVLFLAAVNRLGVEPSQSGVILLSSALIGCCLGFLVFNFAPARIFMGDSGSHLLGMLVGIITILGVAKVTVALALFVPVLALALPIGDTAFAIFRRRRQGVGFAHADARHLHHRLLALGLTPRETAITFYLATAILGCVGLAIFGHRKILAVALGLLLVALALLVWRIWRRGGFAFQQRAEADATRLDRPHG